MVSALCLWAWYPRWPFDSRPLRCTNSFWPTRIADRSAAGAHLQVCSVRYALRWTLSQPADVIMRISWVGCRLDRSGIRRHPNRSYQNPPSGTWHGLFKPGWNNVRNSPSGWFQWALSRTSPYHVAPREQSGCESLDIHLCKGRRTKYAA